MLAKITVQMMADVLDPQGKAVEGALQSLNFHEVKNIRVGRYITLDIDAPDKASAEKRVKEMCEKLLANTTIEDYSFEISD